MENPSINSQLQESVSYLNYQLDFFFALLYAGLTMLTVIVTD